VIPDYTKAFWQVRSPTLKGLNALVGKLRNCIEAGALATGCQVKIEEYVSMYPSYIDEMVTNTLASRNELYTDVRLNDTLCERYQVHMGRYSRNVLKRHDKVLTGSSDIGM
jgi:metal-dependent amidase/aminoacylase/carboxypeptidase family protein